MESIDRDEALALLKPERRQELRVRSHEVTERCVEKRFDFCSIINARSGRCTENCKWCAQSAHWKTGCETYGWVGTDACVKAAKEATAAKCIYVGMSAGIAGSLLTTPGADFNDDRELALRAGYSVGRNATTC